MIINLSNHPSSGWSPQQIQAAEAQYGTIVDLEFPVIDPDWETNVISDLANDYLAKILAAVEASADERNAVYTAGEFVFVYQMVKLLEENDVEAVSATSKREVIEDGEKKISVFKFVRFRNYYPKK